MSVDRTPSDKFERSETQARNTARGQLEIILANPKALLSLRGGTKKLSDARDLDKRMKSGEPFSPGQYSYVDGLYEATMKGLGLPSVDNHRDRRSTLRHPV
jgi:hypothetical protein